MKWNAFDLIGGEIDRTKARLFPFDFKEWFKLMIISLLAGMSSMSFNGPSNLQNFDKFRGINVKDILQKYGWIFGAVLSVMFILGVVVSYIKSVFSFIFLESVIEKKSVFSFRKNHSKGVSLFLFKIVFGIITLVIILLLAMPMIFNLIKGNEILNAVGVWYLVFAVGFLFIYLIGLWLVFLFLQDFVVPYMYSKNVPAWFSLKQIWKEICKNKSEIFVYWLGRLVLGIVMAIIGFIVIVVVFLIFGLIGGWIFAIGVLLYKLIGGLIVLLILGGLIGVILFLIFVMAVAMVLLPLSVFKRYFSLINFEQLMEIKMLKK